MIQHFFVTIDYPDLLLADEMQKQIAEGFGLGVPIQVRTAKIEQEARDGEEKR